MAWESVYTASEFFIFWCNTWLWPFHFLHLYVAGGDGMNHLKAFIINDNIN